MFHPEQALKKNDICFLHCRRGKHATLIHKLCKIVDVHPSVDGLIQTVSVTYLNLLSRKKKILVVDVRRLSLIYTTNHTNEGSSGGGNPVKHRSQTHSSEAGPSSGVVVLL